MFCKIYISVMPRYDPLPEMQQKTKKKKKKKKKKKNGTYKRKQEQSHQNLLPLLCLKPDQQDDSTPIANWHFHTI